MITSYHAYTFILGCVFGLLGYSTLAWGWLLISGLILLALVYKEN